MTKDQALYLTRMYDDDGRPIAEACDYWIVQTGQYA